MQIPAFSEQWPVAMPHMCVRWSRRAALALAAGSMYRSKGGIALQAAVPVTVQTLLALGRSLPPGQFHLWYLHGLWLVANAAGLAFVPHVKVRHTTC